MEQSPQNTDVPEKKKTKSDVIRSASVDDYLRAQSKPNGNGWKGFLHSNLFVALMIYLLSQVGVVGGLLVSYYMRVAKLSDRVDLVVERQAEIGSILKRMDEVGTVNGHYKTEEEDKAITKLELRMDKQEELTRHIEVIETEHRHLVSDVEDLKHGKK